MHFESNSFPQVNPSNAFLRLTLAANRRRAPARTTARTGLRLANGQPHQRVAARRPHGWATAASRRPRPRVLFMPTTLSQRQQLADTLERHPGPPHHRFWSLSTESIRRGTDLLVVGLDPSLGRCLETFCQLQERVTEPILVLIRDDDEALGRRAVRLGAADYIPARQLAGPILALCLRHFLGGRG